MADLITGIDAATQGRLDAAIRKINTAWLNPQQMFEQTLTGQIAYFDYQAGDKIEYWMRLSPFREQAKSLTGTRDFGESGKVKMAEIGFSRWDLYSEFIPSVRPRTRTRSFCNSPRERPTTLRAFRCVE